jgi:hypothetical protein
MTTRLRSAHVALAVPAAALVIVMGALVAPATARSGGTSTGDDPLAVELLSKAMSAPDAVSYTGTQFVGAWSAVDSATSTSALIDVEHTAGKGTVIRSHGAEPTAVLQPPPAATWLADSGPVSLLIKSHTVKVTGTSTIAGRPVYVVEARRPDATVAARLWLDQEYALPLRREVYNESGATLSASAFVEIEIRAANLAGNPSPSVEPGPRSLNNVIASSAHLDHQDLMKLRADGWNCPTSLSKGLALYEAKRVGDAVQLSYTDGVATVSVFEQPGQLDPEALRGFTAEEVGKGTVYRAPGPPSQFVWESGGQVVAVVADASADSVAAVWEALPPDPAESRGLLDRIGRGAQRLWSWVNPFN